MPRAPRLLPFVLIAAPVLAWTGCDAERSTDPDFDRVVELTVEPASLTLPAGAEATLRTRAVLDDGSVRPVTAVWRSDASEVASVEGAGATATVTGVSPGTTRVVARSERHVAEATVSVVPGSEAAVQVIPGRSNLPVGGRIQLSAHPPGVHQRAHPPESVAWSSTDPEVAEVDAHGVVRGRSPGRADITAEVDGAGASSDVSVGTGIHATAPTVLYRAPVVAGLALTPSGGLMASTSTAAGEGSLVLLDLQGKVEDRFHGAPVGRIHPVDPTIGWLLVEEDGVVSIIEEGSYRVRELFRTRRSGVITGTIHDAWTGETGSFGGRIDPSTARFGDFGVAFLPDTLEMFISGVSEPEGLGFLLRFRRAGNRTEHRILVSSTAGEGQEGRVEVPPGVAVDAQARVFSAIPMREAGDAGEAGEWHLAAVRFRRTLEPAAGEFPVFALGPATDLHPLGGAGDGLGNQWLVGGGATPLSRDLDVDAGLVVFAAEGGLVAVVRSPVPLTEVVVEPEDERAYGVAVMPEGDMAVVDLGFSLSDTGS